MDLNCAQHYPSHHPHYGYVKQIESHWCVFNGEIGGEAVFLHIDGKWYSTLFTDKQMTGDFGLYEAALVALETYLQKSCEEGGPCDEDDEGDD